MKVSAAGNSPNTDGIHLQSSSGVSIMNSQISTGDDCISIGPGNSNLWIENIKCGPGHGIRFQNLSQDQFIVANGSIFSLNCDRYFSNTLFLRLLQHWKFGMGYARTWSPKRDS